MAISVVLLFLISGFSVMVYGSNNNQASKKSLSITKDETPKSFYNMSNSINNVTILNLLNNNTYVSPNLKFYNNYGYIGSSIPQYPNYPTLLTSSNTSLFWQFNQSVLMCVNKGETDSSGHNAGIFTYNETFKGNITIDSSLAVSALVNTSNGVFSEGDGFETYLFLNPIYIKNSTDEYMSYAEFYFPQGDVIFPYSLTPYIVIQWDDWRHWDGENTFNMYIVNPETNGVVTYNNITAIGQFGSFYLSSNQLPYENEFQYYLFNFITSYSSNRNVLYTNVSYLGLEYFELDLNLSYYNFTPPQKGIYSFGSGTSGATGSNFGYVYVSLFNTFQTVTKEYNVTFTESGLPSGTSWSVILNGLTEQSTTNTITFTEPNGTYAYEIMTVSGHIPSPLSGNVKVNGFNINQMVTFTQTNYLLNWYNLTNSLVLSPPPLKDSAMCYDAADGYVILYGGMTNNGASNQTWIFKNGVWEQIHPNNSPPPMWREAMVYDYSDQYVLLFGGTNSNTNTYYAQTWIFKAGEWNELSVTNSPPARAGEGLAYDSYDRYVVLYGGTNNYAYSGAGLSDTWIFKGGQWSEIYPSISPLDRDSENQLMMCDDPLINGVLLFGGWNPSGIGGYNLNDTWIYSSGNWKEIYPQNSPYARQGSVMSYDPEINNVFLFGGWSGIFGTPGQLLNDTWIFNYGWNKTSLPIYKITFTETGLPSGTSWSVTLNGSTESSITNTITFQEPNGTYSYTIGSINGYTVYPSSGTINVKGANLTLTITFTANTTTYTITFTESGLPSGASWSVTLNGITKTSTTNTITFTEPYGSYNYTITLPNGYKTSQSSGTITTTQSSMNVPIVISTTSSISPPSSSLNSSSILLIGIILVIVVIAILAGVIFIRRGKSKKPPKN